MRDTSLRYGLLWRLSGCSAGGLMVGFCCFCWWYLAFLSLHMPVMVMQTMLELEKQRQKWGLSWRQQMCSAHTLWFYFMFETVLFLVEKYQFRIVFRVFCLKISSAKVNNVIWIGIKHNVMYNIPVFLIVSMLCNCLWLDLSFFSIYLIFHTCRLFSHCIFRPSCSHMQRH